MYAVIRTGGKQERVAEGQLVRVERLGVPDGRGARAGPLLVVDGERVLATPEELGGAMVTARVVGSELGTEDPGPHLQAEERTAGAASATASSTPRSRSRP